MPRGPRHHLIVGKEEAGERLDRFLARRLPARSRTEIVRWVRLGAVTVGGRPGRAASRLPAGTRIRVEEPAPEPASLEPIPLPLDILHMDADLAVIHKPAGMVVHPGAGVRSPTLVHALLALDENWSLVGGRSRPGIVHRLDRDTSGLIVVARNDVTHRDLSAQFGRREVEKAYDAVVFGHPEATRGRISAPIARDARARSRMAVRDAGRPSETRFEVRERFPHLSLLTVRPLTGRTHQIRVHLAALGHPVAIDPLYGGTARLRALPEGAARLALVAFGRLALHARTLSFNHPADGTRVTFSAPLPEDLARLIEALRSMAT